MSVDWITVGAQIANFLVLVWLLKTLLYRPILDGIDAREAEIATRMDKAVQARARAEATEQTFRDQSRALHLAQAEMSETIRQTAEAQRDVLLTDAKARLEQDHIAWQAHLEDQAKTYIAKLHGAGADAVLAMTRKALLDLSDETLEARMAQHLVAKLHPMAGELRHSTQGASEAVITSHAALPAAVQADMAKALRDLLPDATARFAVQADQTPGLVVRIGGTQVEWTVASYIDGLEQAIKTQFATSRDAKGASV